MSVNTHIIITWTDKNQVSSCAIPDLGRKNTDQPWEWNPEVKCPLWINKKATISKCVFHFARGPLAATCIVFNCKWPWVAYWLASRLNGFVSMLLSQDKATRVQWPCLTPCRSCPRRLPAGYCWGNVRSAALCLAGGKQMDKSQTHAYIHLYYWANEDLLLYFWT